MIGTKMCGGSLGAYKKYMFNTRTERIEMHKPWAKDGKKPYLIYIAWNISPFYYRKGFGLYKIVLGEDVLLLTDYQFSFVLRHTSIRQKLLRKKQAVVLTDLVKTYSSIKPDEIENAELILNDIAKEAMTKEDSPYYTGVQKSSLSSV